MLLFSAVVRQFFAKCQSALIQIDADFYSRSAVQQSYTILYQYDYRSFGRKGTSHARYTSCKSRCDTSVKLAQIDLLSVKLTHSRPEARRGGIFLRSLQPGHLTLVGICTSGPYRGSSARCASSAGAGARARAVGRGDRARTPSRAPACASSVTALGR